MNIQHINPKHAATEAATTTYFETIFFIKERLHLRYFILYAEPPKVLSELVKESASSVDMVVAAPEEVSWFSGSSNGIGDWGACFALRSTLLAALLLVGVIAVCQRCLACCVL